MPHEMLKQLKKLTTPIKIQDFLDRMPINYEKKGETYMSVTETLKAGKAHCFEGALVAAAALSLQGEKPLLLDLKARKPDVDHVVALYKKSGRWGAISKTNHASIRFRDPIYKSIRELAASYFHEYFYDKTGEKTLVSHSLSFNLETCGIDWRGSNESLDELVDKIDAARHFAFYPSKNKKYLRKADAMERKAGELIEWKKSDRRT
jgi:hypothetical protein